MNKPTINIGQSNVQSANELYFKLVEGLDAAVCFIKNELDIAIKQYNAFDISQEQNLKNEDDITTVICRYLEENIPTFRFEPRPKTPEKNGGADIGILLKSSNYYKHIILFVIEAKRLPTPKPYSINRQETEYVSYANNTKQGGVERFKTDKHKGHFEMDFMFGYIQEKDATFWHKQINHWIESQIAFNSRNISWNERDKLIVDKLYRQKPITKLTSKHFKVTNKEIQLVHYWIDLQ